MKLYELIQKAYNGGFPIPNDSDPFGHGTPLYVVSSRELLSLLYRVTPNDAQTKQEIEEILKQDTFVQRDPDLPGETILLDKKSRKKK